MTMTRHLRYTAIGAAYVGAVVGLVQVAVTWPYVVLPVLGVGLCWFVGWCYTYWRSGR